MSGTDALTYVALSALMVGGWAALGWGGRKAWEWATRQHHGRRR
jgi:hypothetical protein